MTVSGLWSRIRDNAPRFLAVSLSDDLLCLLIRAAHGWTNTPRTCTECQERECAPVASADLVVTITTETKGRIRARRVATLSLAAACATAAAVVLPSALSGGNGSTQVAAAAVAYTADAPDVTLDCSQWAGLTGQARRDAATFWEVTTELATRVRAPGDLSAPSARAVADEAREIDDSCRVAAVDAQREHMRLSPLVVRALRDFRRP